MSTLSSCISLWKQRGGENRKLGLSSCKRKSVHGLTFVCSSLTGWWRLEVKFGLCTSIWAWCQAGEAVPGWCGSWAAAQPCSCWPGLPGWTPRERWAWGSPRRLCHPRTGPQRWDRPEPGWLSTQRVRPLWSGLWKTWWQQEENCHWKLP